ncbi:hypothetical protein DL769_006707 [Monosporascus sp. CRB-8-3]|nr:hypothetical protein DL769_006707 [Monosporascus sp. CRB-8-3]
MPSPAEVSKHFEAAWSEGIRKTTPKPPLVAGRASGNIAHSPAYPPEAEDHWPECPAERRAGNNDDDVEPPTAAPLSALGDIVVAPDLDNRSTCASETVRDELSLPTKEQGLEFENRLLRRDFRSFVKVEEQRGRLRNGSFLGDGAAS